MQSLRAVLATALMAVAACGPSGTGAAPTTAGAGTSVATAPASPSTPSTAGTTITTAASRPTATTASTGGVPSNGSTGSSGSTGSTVASVPAGYRGRWNSNRADCGAEVSEGQLTVAATRVDFYESGGPVTAVATSGDTVTVTVQLTGEGSTWIQELPLQLSAAGQQLTDLSTGTLRYRCS